MTLAGLAVSLGLAGLLVPAWLRDMSRAGLVRENWRGRMAAFPSGAVLVAVSLIALAPLALLDDRAELDLLEPELRRWAVFVLGVAMLGLLDDSLGRASEADSPRGWRGHARAVLGGRFSTGAIKAVGAFSLAAYAVSGRGRESLDYLAGTALAHEELLADLALLLLTTNLFNLLDLRPGRVEKVFFVLIAGLCLGAWTAEPLELLGLFIGPVIVGTAFSLRERAMLGDTGSNLVGALAGVALLEVLGDDARLIALAVVAALTVYGEFRSLNSAIERIPPLRYLDSLGRAG
jgi:hypothetical protein